MDKLAKVRDEIEKLKSQLLRGACSSQIAMETRCKEEAYNEVLAILDSLQEEPVSNPTPNEKMSVERWKIACEAACCDINYRSHYGFTETRDDYFVDGVQWADEHPKEEPVSEDLEEASKEWLKPQLDKSYADYGETKMMELTHFDGYAMLDAIEFGAKWKEKKMMRNAIDVTVHIDSGGYPYIPQIEFYDYDKDVPLAKKGDKYKVVLIKYE